MDCSTESETDTVSSGIMNDNLGCHNAVLDSVVEGAHTKENLETARFVDIFVDTDTKGTFAANDTNNISASDADGIEPNSSVMPTPVLDSKKLTFSDRVLHEAKKLRQRLKRTVSADAEQVTRGVDRTNIATNRRAVTDSHLSPYTSLSATQAASPYHSEPTRYEDGPSVPTGGSAGLRMRSNIQIMEWFRNRFNAIDSAYAERAIALGELERCTISVNNRTEPTQAPSTDILEELERLKQENDRLNLVEETQSQLKQQLSEALANVEELENSLTIERKHNEENLKDKMLLQQRIANYADENKSLNESIDILKNMHSSEVEEHEKRKAELLAKVAQLQMDITHINDNLFSCYKVVEAQKTEHAYLKRENDELKEELKRLRRDLRQMYETNSSLKSQNLSLIEINSRIRTKTLFKTDTAETCSTRVSSVSKTPGVARDDFAFFHVFNDTPSAVRECPNMDSGGKDADKNELNSAHNIDTMRSVDTFASSSSVIKRTVTDEYGPNRIYNPKNIFGDEETQSFKVNGEGMGTAFVEHSDTPEGANQHDDMSCTVAYNNTERYVSSDASSRGTYRVDHSTVYSAGNSTPYCVESLDGRSLTIDALSEGSITVKNKSWLIERVSRVSNRDSLDYLREKIKLITSQECRDIGMV
ncbi:uncharacterized protein BXIN_0391 [Babesia sp. Xinjiang]|uniref:uncharacterized protein n=1 Tax=Babesia sp. Xinjiang TaxID=462227 RepID=UPI000A2516B4|nr:uncharacterized protein BXIN_0391 [Babesia sp. Xinjiang]ORM41055.1 hypothetical protein BXIN_0391 [Babesia sp. Xinjiang]